MPLKQSHRQFRALRSKRSAQAGLTGLVLLAGAVFTPAHAGSWVLDHYDLNGQNVWSPATMTQSPQIWESPVAAADAPNGIVKSATASKQGSGTGASFTVSAKSGGNLTAVFKWIPTQGQTLTTDPPPAYLDLLISSNATSQSYLQTNGNITYTWEAHLDNGKRQWITPEIAINQTVSLQDKQLLRVAAGSETVEVTRQVNADNKIVTTSHATTNYSGQSNYYGTANAGVSSQLTFKALPDDRNVKLHRQGSPTPKLQGTPGVTIDPLKDEWIDTKGDAYGHTTWSYKDYSAPIPATLSDYTMRINYEVIYPEFSGNWLWMPDPNQLAWSWNPPGLPTDWDVNAVDIPHGGKRKNSAGKWENVEPSPANKTKFIRYNAWDLDGAQASPLYNLMCHEEWENLRTDSGNPFDLQTKQFPPGPSVGNFWQQAEVGAGPRDATFTGTIYTEESDTIGASGGFTIEDFFTFGIDASHTWSKSYGTEFGVGAQVSEGKQRYFYIELDWYRKNYLVDHYVESGWDKNPARTDGAYTPSYDDLSPGSVTEFGNWSPEYEIDDFNGDGTPD